jgi:hypothetical protein
LLSGHFPMTTDFDKGARYAARRLDAEGFLRWLMGEKFWSAWEWKDWLDTQAVPFPGEPDRRMDTVAAFERRAHDLAGCEAAWEKALEDWNVEVRHEALGWNERMGQEARSSAQLYR